MVEIFEIGYCCRFVDVCWYKIVELGVFDENRFFVKFEFYNIFWFEKLNKVYKYL